MPPSFVREMSEKINHIESKRQIIPELRFSEFSGYWNTQLFKDSILKIESGWSPICLSESAQQGEWGSLKTTSISWEGYEPRENKKLPGDLIPREDTEVYLDDILITRVGPKERVGVVVVFFYFAFVQHMVHQLNNNGTMACVLPHGVLFRGAAEGHIRKYLIDDRNYLDAVIGLPALLR